MRKTLYLAENEEGLYLRVDGPSLLIRSAHSAERRVPLRVLGRVIIFGNIQIDTDVLTLLAENNIPVFLISKWARNLSISMNPHYAIEGKCITLRSIIKDRGKSLEFFKWAKEKRSHIETTVLKCLLGHRGVNHKDYSEIISFFLPYDRDKWKNVRKILKMLFWCLIIEELMNRDLHPHYGIIHRGIAFGLARDCLYVMSAEIDLQALQFFKSDSIEKLIEPSFGAFCLTSRGIHNIVARFENKQYIAKKIMDDITVKLFELAQCNEG